MENFWIAVICFCGFALGLVVGMSREPTAYQDAHETFRCTCDRTDGS